MRTLFISLIVFVSSMSVLRGEASSTTCVNRVQKIQLFKKPQTAFSIGEKFKYAIKYEFIKAGESTLEVTEGAPVNCRRTYRIESLAKSAKYLDNIFKVRDYNAASMDQESLMSLGFHQNLREGDYRVIRTTTIDYVNGQYKFVKERKGKTSTADGLIKQPVSDILSAFYLTRTLPLELGQEYFIDVFSDPDIYRLKVSVSSKFEDVTVPAGTFECFKIQPFVVGDAIFKAREGQMLIWLTSDQRRMPVLIRSKVSIGAFDAELLEFDTPKSDMVNEKVPTR